MNAHTPVFLKYFSSQISMLAYNILPLWSPTWQRWSKGFHNGAREGSSWPSLRSVQSRRSRRSPTVAQRKGHHISAPIHPVRKGVGGHVLGWGNKGWWTKGWAEQFLWIGSANSLSRLSNESKWEKEDFMDTMHQQGQSEIRDSRVK